MQSKNKIKVLLLWPNIKYPGNNGGSIHLTELVNSLSKYVKLGVICKCEKDFSEKGVDFYSVKSGKFSLLSYPKINSIIKKYDVINSRADPFELSGLISSRINNKPIIGEVNVNFLAYEKKGTYRDFFYPILNLIKYSWVKCILPRYSMLTTVSEEIRKSLINHKLNPKKIKTINNGGNSNLYKDLDRDNLRKKIGVINKELVFLLAGELGPRHGIKEILQIDFSKTSKQIIFLFVGGADRYSEFISNMKEKSRFIMKSNPNIKFVFTGRVPYVEMKKYVFASDVVLAPYRESDNNELFGFSPIKILEAMAAGKPILASDRPWIREVLSEKEGVITNDFSKGFYKILSSKNLEEMGKMAKLKIKEEFSWDITAKKYLNIYKKLIK